MTQEAHDPSLARYSFRRKLDEVAAARGRATELVSLYVPPGRQISDVMSYLRNEYSQSGNIKSRTTRKNVLWAIDSLMGRVRQYKAAPPNGVAFFVGSKAVGADRTEPITFVIEPPEPLSTYLYRCDSTFFLDPLLEMVSEPELWGLIVIDRAEATLGFLRGKRIEALRNKQSLVPSKHGRGGQSAHRFERLIEHAAHEFFVRVGEIATELFLPKVADLRGILLGGPGATKEYFHKQNYLHYELQQKVVTPFFNVGYTDEQGLKELVAAAGQTIHGLAVTEERRIVQQLFTEIRKSEGALAAYGEPEVLRALDAGAVATLLLSEGLRKLRVRFRGSCGHEFERTLSESEIETVTGSPCPVCHGPNPEMVSRGDYVEELYARARAGGAEVRLISDESEEGTMLAKAFGGVAALLRFPLPRALPSTPR